MGCLVGKIERIGEGLKGCIGGLKANVSLVCAVNDTYSCFGHGYWSNDDDWLNGDDWRNEDIVED